jgi:twitching motility protein PilT
MEGWAPMDGEGLRELAAGLVGKAGLERLDGVGDVNGAAAWDGVRFRYNVYRRGQQECLAVRLLEARVKPLGELGLPESLYGLCELGDGLVMVAGPTGSGKSMTLAALVDRINRTQSVHVVTIEDPVEYVHAAGKGLVNQREVGKDCGSFHEALVAALRQDPDVILVGEVRELETMRVAMTAAETGHLVFTTVHAGDCAGAVERWASVFPANEQEGVRRQLSLVLRAVVAQHLLPADGAGSGATLTGRRRRVVACEVLRVNAAVANLVATGRSAQVYSAMEVGQGLGMQTLDQDLARLVATGKVLESTAITLARNPAVFRERVRRGAVREGHA